MIGHCNKGHRVDVQKVSTVPEGTTDTVTVSMYVCGECDRIKCPHCQVRVLDGSAHRCPTCRKALVAV